MHLTLVPDHDPPHLMMVMPHPHFPHVSKAVRCTHSIGPAWYPLSTPHTHTPHFRHYYTMWCGRGWSADMHSPVKPSGMALKDLPTAVSLRHLDYPRGHTC